MSPTFIHIYIKQYICSLSIKKNIYKMFESTPQTPLIDFKGSNLHLIHINLDNSENSTKESNISGENSKCLDDTIDEQKYIIEPKRT